jgi:hypothetical protein
MVLGLGMRRRRGMGRRMGQDMGQDMGLDMGQDRWRGMVLRIRPWAGRLGR